MSRVSVACTALLIATASARKQQPRVSEVTEAHGLLAMLLVQLLVQVATMPSRSAELYRRAVTAVCLGNAGLERIPLNAQLPVVGLSVRPYLLLSCCRSSSSQRAVCVALRLCSWGWWTTAWKRAKPWSVHWSWHERWHRCAAADADRMCQQQAVSVMLGWDSRAVKVFAVCCSIA
jgi:hypothetical protein